MLITSMCMEFQAADSRKKARTKAGTLSILPTASMLLRLYSSEQQGTGSSTTLSKYAHHLLHAHGARPQAAGERIGPSRRKNRAKGPRGWHTWNLTHCKHAAAAAPDHAWIH
eukprot:scaffold115196_cov23-Tisochrysis_lutea.AAC.3